MTAWAGVEWRETVSAWWGHSEVKSSNNGMVERERERERERQSDMSDELWGVGLGPAG